MKPHIGYYVHHHGRGHVSRTRAVLAHLRTPATVLTSATVTEEDLPGTEVLPLPMDTGHPETEVDVPVATRTLHHAPIGVPGARRRAAAIARWIDEHEPALVVVDVSAEVAQLCRLLATPVTVVRQHGDRTDPAHLAAYDAAVALLAPYPEWLEDPSTPRQIRERTTYVGGFSRFDGRRLDQTGAREMLDLDPAGPVVTVMAGGGSERTRLDAVRRAARALPRWTFLCPGEKDDGVPPNVVAPGWVDDPYPWLRAADLLVTSAGHNSVMEAATADVPLVVIPEPRPFGEQEAKAELLDVHRLALVRPELPEPDGWPTMLDLARGRRATPLVGGDGAARAARHLDRLVERFS